MHTRRTHGKLDVIVKPIVLTFVAYYLPGYKSGGPLRTIANLVEHLGDEFNFRIITGDREAQDTRSYPGVTVNTWSKVGKAQVFYATREHLSLGRLQGLLRNTPYDAVYLNSFFDRRFTIYPLILRRLRLIPHRPVLIAPRGEFSEGALNLKRGKKLAFIRMAQLCGLYEGVTWQASSSYEEADIRRVLGTTAKSCIVAPDMPPTVGDTRFEQSRHVPRENGPLRIIFLSRITPMKNLDFALRVLAQLPFPVHFNIYGPISDVDYWGSCLRLMNQLPTHVSATYHGPISHDHVAKVMAENDLFFLPSRGENYGHVIPEALSAGTPVLISDRTPWRNLADAGVGWDVPLESEATFVQKIIEFESLPIEDYMRMRWFVKRWIRERLTDTSVISANRAMLLRVLNRD